MSGSQYIVTYHSSSKNDNRTISDTNENASHTRCNTMHYDIVLNVPTTIPSDMSYMKYRSKL